MSLLVPTDLHGHTFLSDGRATPEEYVEFRRRLGMRAIAIADHDILAGVRRGAAAASAAGMMFIPALEVTAFLHHGKREAEQFHVLAYFPDYFLGDFRLEQTVLYRRGQIVQQRWREFVLEWMSTLTEQERTSIDPESELERTPAHAFPALQSMILRIVERARPMFERFRDDHVLFWEGDRNKDIFAWSPEEAIEAIRGDGAVDIVAHPTRYRDKERTLRVLELASGLEVYTSRHKAEVSAHYREYAETNRKHWTSSSDDHQNAKYYRPPCGTPARTLERICHKQMPMHSIVAA